MIIIGAIEFTGKKEPEEPYVPRHFTQKEIEAGIEEFNVIFYIPLFNYWFYTII